MSDLVAARLLVYGIVQGVFFRDFTARHARGLGIGGFIRNLPDGAVEVLAEGSRDSLDRLIEHLRTGPPRAVIENIDIAWGAYTGKFAGFTIKY